MRTPVRWSWTTVSLLLMVTILASCTRDRVALEPVPTATSQASQEPLVTQVDPASAAGGQPTVEPGTTTTPPRSGNETMLYIVQSGDTISTIAEKFGTTTETLRQLNLLVNDNIQAGQVLRVPMVEGATAEGLPTATPEPFRYVVQSGDTLGGIALQFDLNPATILEANGLADPNSLRVGQELIIPDYTLPAAEGAPPATAGGPAVLHTVRSGETLSQIAESYGTTTAELMEANNISDPNLVAAGQQLRVPGVRVVEEGGQQNAIHVVKAGESLLSIAVLYGVDSDAIVAANNIQDPNVLRPGQELVIPGITSRQAQAAQQIVHVVQAGDSLLDIALRYGVTPAEIMEANDMADPNLLDVGQRLIIPEP